MLLVWSVLCAIGESIACHWLGYCVLLMGVLRAIDGSIACNRLEYCLILML